MKHRKKEFKNLRNFRNLLNLKKDYENKTKQLKSSIVSTRRYHAEIEKKKKQNGNYFGEKLIVYRVASLNSKINLRISLIYLRKSFCPIQMYLVSQNILNS